MAPWKGEVQSLTVVIVSWNCRNALDRCLRSVKESKTSAERHIVVVDNASEDGTVPLLRSRYPDVQVMVNKENRGYAAATNQGLRTVRTEYVALLNPDTVVRDGAFDALGRFLDTHRDAWVVGPRMLTERGAEHRSGVRFPTNWNILVEALFLDRLFPRSRVFGAHKELYADRSRPREVEYLQGSCLMARADVLTTVGLLDERFFLYFEETDWCYRIRAAGGKVFHVPAATVVHAGASELGHYDERRLVHYHRSWLLFFEKHHSTLSTLALRGILVIRTLIRLVAWAAVAALRPSLRGRALSALAGYRSSLRIVLGLR